MEELDRVPLYDEADEDDIEGQITFWTRIVCGLMLVGLWLCAASLYLAMYDA